MHLRRRSVVPVAVVALLLLAVPAVAKINPDFTPNHIVQKATQIMLLKLKPADAKGLVRSVVRRALKGAKPETAPVIDLTITAHTEHAKLVKQDIARLGEAPVLLFIGEDEDGEEKTDAQKKEEEDEEDEADNTVSLSVMEEMLTPEVLDQPDPEWSAG